MKHKTYDCGSGCSVEATLELISGKWKGVIITHLLDGPRRFNELNRKIADITQRMLAKQLKEMEEAGLLARTVLPTKPPMVEYSLTELGASLRPIINSLKSWGDNLLEITTEENIEK